jgi:hypothetical protein
LSCNAVKSRDALSEIIHLDPFIHYIIPADCSASCIICAVARLSVSLLLTVMQETHATTMVTPTRLISFNNTCTSSTTLCAASLSPDLVKRRISFMKTRAITPHTWMAKESMS